MSDLISRQDAIDAIDRLDIPEDMCVFDILSHIELEIGTLPSAQPYTDEEIQKMQDIEQAQLDKIRELAYQDGKADAMAKIIHCKDCYYRYGRYCHYRYTNGLFISADHYCGFAKRQEDDK